MWLKRKIREWVKRKLGLQEQALWFEPNGAPGYGRVTNCNTNILVDITGSGTVTGLRCYIGPYYIDTYMFNNSCCVMAGDQIKTPAKQFVIMLREAIMITKNIQLKAQDI